MKNDIKFKIIEMLQTLDVCIPNSLETQYVVRCPYCGDSRNPSNGHFSIHIDVSSDTPLLYRCFRCDASGIINSTVLDDIGLYAESNVIQELRSFNRKIIRKNKYVDNSTKNYHVTPGTDSLKNLQKLKYVNERIGTDFLHGDATEIKVILDIFEFMKHNEIKSIPNVSFGYLNLLNNNYVGFLSTNNNCITFRRINENEKLRRYVKMVLDPLNINTNTFYSIPNSLDLLYTHSIDIHITEGIFDILSVYNNLKGKDRCNNYYYASCGFGYLTIIKYLVYNGINTGLNLHIYSDKDKTDRNHMNYLFNNSEMSIWLDSINIHRNIYTYMESGIEIMEKDYGVPKNRIIDSVRKVQ